MLRYPTVRLAGLLVASVAIMSLVLHADRRDSAYFAAHLHEGEAVAMSCALGYTRGHVCAAAERGGALAVEQALPSGD